jgi:glycosyltransferase involved in cell wall biosynthesis
MKILIDGGAFAETNQTQAMQFWQQTIPKLVNQLQSERIYFLNRTTSSHFPEIDRLQSLFAPAVDFQNSATEDRRLKALCRELEIDVFISTYNTSAGTDVKSLLLLWQDNFTPANEKDPVWISQQRAMKMAASYLAISESGVNYLHSVTNISPSQVRLVDLPSTAEDNGEVIAKELAIAIEQLKDYQPDAEVQARRLAEEKATEAQAAELRQLAEAEAVRLWNSALNRTIAPEVKDDEFYTVIQKLAAEADIKTVLEIGSSSGEGSTKALVTGLQQNPQKTQLFCLEVSQPRFAELKNRYASDKFVKCYNYSSVSLEQFPSENEVRDFYQNQQSRLNYYPLEQVLGWLQEGIEYQTTAKIPDRGIQRIKDENNIDTFDMVLIDGSEFTGEAELEEVYGAKIILLDDTQTFKSYRGYQRLFADPNYQLIASNPFVRNGYAVFQRTNSLKEENKPNKLPIHFFTIVLNGEPFIRYHIDVFKQLPFDWHWHIVEGVADLKHDTAWSANIGGRITDEFHRGGYSNDGTREYLDELAQKYPENITIYRQPEGVFWDGKRSMVNAPLANIHEECLLWQVDNDELWSFEQICNARKMFIENPRKTAAFYWCWYFVGEDLVISTRNCYAQNPRQEWLRTWRFKPGFVWAAHEPPILVENLPDGQQRNVAAIDPFGHNETEKYGLVFQHYAYVTLDQLRFKEQYYGYQNAIAQWSSLQAAFRYPVFLRDYFAWVRDETEVDYAASCGVLPIANREPIGSPECSAVWHFNQPQIVLELSLKKPSVKILVDGVFFQLYQTGIARVWKSLLEEWVKNGFANHVVVLDRANTAPQVPGAWYRTIPAYDYNNTAGDREMLQQICDEEGADLFISTYYTTPTTTPSVFMAYDMIPEAIGADLNHPIWREKHYGIQHAASYISISENTARDLVRFFPNISPESITVAHCGVASNFTPASSNEINTFKTRYGISKPYFIIAGTGGYKNVGLFFQAFAKLATKSGFEIVLTGASELTDEWRKYTSGCVVHSLRLSDEELRLAYAGAVALVYPSQYEGFGLPVLEALACGCPVITCPNASLPEVAGEAALYVKDNDVDGLANALCEVQKPSIRQSLIAKGLEQAKKFSWDKMASAVSTALINATLLPLKLSEINFIVFPDWTADEEALGMELTEIMGTIASHPDKSRMTLLIDRSDISEEDANMFLSSIAMNLMMSEELDVAEGPEISLVGQLSEIQWQALLPKLQGRIALENENQNAIASAKAETIAVQNLENLN